ncbi:MAG: branched-chain amino acid aminotransferase [Luteibaculaceae bacterium]|jgi:branched-chain amino acid aminotransferase
MLTIPSKINISQTKESKINQVDFENLAFGKVFSDHMFVAEYKNGAWGDLSIEPYGPLSMSPATSVIHYGQSVFEGMKAYRMDSGDISFFRPEENMNRLNASAVRMGMPELPFEIFKEGLNALVKMDKAWVPKKPGASLYIRPFMFATDEYIGVRSSDTYKFIIITSPVLKYYDKPVKVKIEETFSRAVPGGVGEAKAAGNYAASLYPAAQGKKEGYDQLVWTDAKDHKNIEESGTMNIMFVVDGVVYTPKLTGSILRGITRKSVITLLESWGVEVKQIDVSVDFVIDAIKQGKLTEAFGVGTAATIAQIKVIGFRGTDFELAEVNTRTISLKVSDYFAKLKSGVSQDEFSWMEGLK